MMKRLMVLLAVVALVAVGCAKKPEEPVVNKCIQGAPGWVLMGSAEGGISSVGSAAIGAAGLGFARTEALANGRDELARQMSVKVQNMVKNFTQVTGVGDAQTVDKVASQVSKQIANQVLSGSRQANTWMSPCNELYVLVAIDPAVVKASVNEGVQTSFKNDQALWQQFQAKKAQDDLSAEIEKEFK